MAVTEFSLPPSSTRELAALGEIMSGLENVQAVISDEPLRHEAEGARLRIFAKTQDFVNQHPELQEYYRSLVADYRSSGLPEDTLLEDDRYYEATLFMELFAPEIIDPEDNPAAVNPQQRTLYINGQEITQDEALILFAEILYEQGTPMTVGELRSAGLAKYIDSEDASQRRSLFASLRKRFKRVLVQTFETDEFFREEGPTRARRYSLEVGQLTVLAATSSEDSPSSTEEPHKAEASSTTDETVLLVIEDDNSEAVDTSNGDPEITESNEVEALNSPTVELYIRGEPYRFSLLQKQIIDAVLSGRHRMRDIISFLQGGEGWTDQDYFANEVLPAFRGLEQLRFEGEPLLRQVRLKETDYKVIEYHLPPNARLEYSRRKNITSLVFTDPSTFTAGKPAKRSPASLIPQEELLESQEPVPTPRERRATAVKKPSKDAVISARISGEKMIKSNGVELKLDIFQRKILRALADGKRRTIAEIVRAVSDPDQPQDSTVNAVVADILATLQRELGSDSLSRKKGKPGQPVRWWLVPQTVVFEN